MNKLTDIVKKITQKYNIVEYEITSDQFIFEKKNKDKVKTKKCLFCDNETIGTICEKFECYEKFEKL